METTLNRKIVVNLPDEEMSILAKSSLKYANSYYNTFHKCLTKLESRFDVNLLYQLAVMSVEKYFVALLARYDWAATHHMPVALYKEALAFDSGLTPEMKQTVILVGKFEAICSIDAFGYRQPDRNDLLSMDDGIMDIKKFVEGRLSEI